jgi:O-succinylhomoserine sulfhydrylase
MKKLNPEGYGLKTLAVRAGQEFTAEQEHSEPLFLSSSFVFQNAAEAAARFKGDAPGNIYSRFTNPTVRTFEERLAAMEGGERCIATSSGMSAILTTCMGLLRAGDHIVSSRAIFGTTVGLFENVLSRFGVTTTFVPQTDYSAWEAAITKDTKLLFLETPSNPLTEIADIARLAELAEKRGVLLVVDNCFCTPALQKPLALGAHLVIHSATKYLDGQGRVVGGAVIGMNKLLEENLFPILRTAGPSMSPFNAWVFLKGLQTLDLRMQSHCANAGQLAGWLEKQKRVKRVYYPGLASHPDHALAKRQQSAFGGIVAFEVEGGREAAFRVIDGTELFSITANLGDAKSTITHPATTTHHRLSPDQRAEAGIAEGLIRLSVGLEDWEDLRNDLDRALRAAAG